MRPRPQNPSRTHFLVLAPDAFGVGGIERATRALVDALSELYGAGCLTLLSVWGPKEKLPTGVANSRKAMVDERVSLARQVAFSFQATRVARRFRGHLAVIACHPHLAPVAWACGRAGNGPVLVWSYGIESWGRLPLHIRMSLRAADRIAAVSAFTAQTIRQSVGLQPESVTVCPLSVPEELASLRLDAATSDQSNDRPTARSVVPTVLTVSRLIPSEAYKGIDTLLYAWLRVRVEAPQAELVIVGDGPDRRRLEQIVALLDLDGVTFAGRLSDKALASVYASASVFALPSRARLGASPQGEGFGLVYVEAGAAGLPVVAGRVTAVPEVVGDGETGILVDPEDATEVAEAIVRLLADPALARALGEGGRARAVGEFSFQAFSQRISHLIGELTAPETTARRGELQCAEY